MNDSQPSDDRSRQDAWTRYWSTGALHSCVTSFAGNYEGPIANFWLHCFDALADGARILDIATGNGPVPQLLFAHAGQRGVSCEAIDLARISPAWPAALPAAQSERLHFHSGVGAEALPFAAHAFDLVTSQYGLEYSQLDHSLPELARVLRPGGAIGCVLHHAQSLTVRLAASEVGHSDWLVARGGLLELGLAMVEPVSRADTPQGRDLLASDPNMESLRERFNASQDEAAQHAAVSECPDVLHEARAVIAAALDEAARGGPAAACERIGNYRDALGDAALRLRELRSCALDEGGLAALCARLAALGIAAQAVPLRDVRGLYGWGLRGRKSSS